MPIHEYYCQRCDKEYERLYPWKSGEAGNYTDDPDMELCDCGEPAHRLASLTVNRSDPFWSGVVTNHGYVTSLSSYNQILKKKNITPLSGRGDYEAMHKLAAEGAKRRDERIRQNNRAIVEKALEGVVIEPDAETRAAEAEYAKFDLPAREPGKPLTPPPAE
jgi:hypothetical protein